MKRFGIILGLCLLKCFDLAVLNGSCPIVAPRELNWKEFDGKWYLEAVSTEPPVDGDCAMVMFNHKQDNTTDISISWISNNTATYYNGSVQLVDDPKGNGTGDVLSITYTDNVTEKYSVLDINYEHYAVILACSEGGDGNGTYFVWKMTRSPHLKDDEAAKMNAALQTYNLMDSQFKEFNNSESSCKLVNGGSTVNPSSLVLTSAAAMTILRRLY